MLTLNIFEHFSSVSFVNFEPMNVCWVSSYYQVYGSIEVDRKIVVYIADCFLNFTKEEASRSPFGRRNNKSPANKLEQLKKSEWIKLFNNTFLLTFNDLDL